MRLWKLASSKTAVQASRLEILAGVDVEVLNLKAVWRPNSFFFGGPQSFISSLSTDWMWPTHIMESHQLYSESSDLNGNHIFKNLSVTLTDV